ncbi:MAG: DUF2232 domain-containing protein [Mariprofundaceae bacterium]
MFTAILWLPAGLQEIPVISLLVATLVLTIHLLTPALFALITFGGGINFSLQVAGIAAIAVTALSGFQLLPGLAMFTLYALLPVMTAVSIQKPGGLSRSAQHLMLGMAMATFAALLAGASAQHVGMYAFVDQLLAPVFDVMGEQVRTSGGQEAIQMLVEARRMTVWIFPGMIALCLWLTWWSNLLLARRVAVRYGFYRGEQTAMLNVRFSKPLAGLFLLALALANLAADSVQYVALGITIAISGMLAIQGIAVVHTWLKLRGMQLTIIIMYLILLMWSVMVLPFVMVGLLDIWFDYRRNMQPAHGG